MLVSLLSVPVTSGPAAAVTGVALGVVQPVSDPGVTLAVPVDGRLNGYRFAGRILGAAVGTAVPTLGLRAAPGQRLWVFGLRWTADQVPDGPSSADPNYTPAQITATIVYDGQRVPVPLTQSQQMSSAAGSQPSGVDSGPEYFVASVPTGATDVVVELASAGYAQDFSLTHMTREGQQPAALYRDASGWQTVADLQAEKDLPTPYNDGVSSLPGAQLIVKLPDVTLSYFGPDSPTDTAPGLDQAWLVPDLEDPLQYPDQITFSLEYGDNVTAADMTLTLPGGKVVHPQTLPGGPDPQQWTTDGSTSGRSTVFPYIYAFAVPADLTTATLAINFPPELAIPAYSGSSGVTVNPGTATFPLTLPPPSSLSPPAGAASAPAPIRAATTSAQPKSHRSSSSAPSEGPLIAGLAALLVVALAAGWLLRRRHPIASTSSPSSDVDGTLIATAPTPDGNGERPARAPTPDDGPPHPDAHNDHGVVPAAPPVHPSGPPATQPARLIPIPHDPPLSGSAIRILVLGPVILVGWPEGIPRPGQTALEILAFLALHPGQKFSTEQLRNTIGRGRSRDIDLDTIRRYIRELRRVLGERLPESRRGGGYQITGVATDAGDFNALVEAAAASTATEERAGHLAGALAMVRGVPFADSPKNDFAWVHLDEQIASKLSNRIRTAAIDLADLALEAGDAALAEWAADRGFRVFPGDEDLDDRTLRAAALAGVSRLDQAWSALDSRMVAGEKADPSPRLRALYESLRRQLTEQPVPGRPAL